MLTEVFVYSSANVSVPIGGGMRFHPNVYVGMMKLVGLEQVEFYPLNVNELILSINVS